MAAALGLLAVSSAGAGIALRVARQQRLDEAALTDRIKRALSPAQQAFPGCPRTWLDRCRIVWIGPATRRETGSMWILFQVPTPTPDGQTAEDLYRKRVLGITPEMQNSARQHGCTFHRAWFAVDGSSFWAIAQWESSEGASAFFDEWEIDDEPGEVAFRLEGDIGLVPLP